MEDALPVETMKKAVRGISYIAHPLRLRILETLDVNGESSVSEITNTVKEEQVIVSQSLRKLRDANLVKTNRRGIFIFYSIDEEYPASLFKCMRKLYGYMANDFYFLVDGYKAFLPQDYTTMVANRIKLFANFDKMRILEYLLLHGESNVSDIVNGIDSEQIKVSQYLKRLKDDAFVTSRRDGRFIYYSLTKGVHASTLQCIRYRYQHLEDKNNF